MPHFWCGVMKFSAISGLPFGLIPWIAGSGLQVHRRAVAGKALAKREHPRMVHVELLAPGQRAPRNQLVHVGVAGVVRNGLAFDAAPGRRADDLARLRLDVAKADLLVFAMDRQVRVIAPGLLAQRLPRLDRHMAVGLGREHHHDFAASMSVSIFGMPRVGPSAVTTPLSSPSCFTSFSVFQRCPCRRCRPCPSADRAR